MNSKVKDIAECVAINAMLVSTLVFLWCQI